MNEYFKKVGFKIVRHFYDVKKHSKKHPDLYEFLLNSKHLSKVDSQVKGADSFYNNIELKKMLLKSFHRMELETGLKLYPTYAYARIYNSTSELKRHKDRPACEISVTVNIGYRGSYSWPIYIMDFSGNEHEVTLAPGDGLIYHGSDLEHWRNPADERVKKHAQGFLHFVRQDELYENYILDNRPVLRCGSRH